MKLSNLFITAILLLAHVSCSAADKFIPAADSNVLFMGRTVKTPSGAVAFNYPGVTAMLNFSGPSLEMFTSPGSGYFMVEIDSMPPRKVFFSPSQSSVVLADSLADKPHSARITYAVEGFEFNPQIAGFGLADSGKLLDAPCRPDLKIEFIGDSMTCGYGTEADSGSVPFSYDTENHCLGFAHLTARMLDADYNVVARSGIGVYRNYRDPASGSTGAIMPGEYGHTMLYNPEYEWDFSRFVPDVICINLGTNDVSEDKYDIKLYEKAYSAFLKDVRSKNPGASIILLTGSMLKGKQLQDVRNALDRVAENQPGVYRFDMTPQTGELGYGGDWHPSAAQSRLMANELSAFIRSVIDPNRNLR